MDYQEEARWPEERTKALLHFMLTKMEKKTNTNKRENHGQDQIKTEIQLC